ncbi:hypothetical protein [uncultured Winogradskyella sp.]|uniref:hypothetical protein n=1 Tax=uncultured Winogradskyella sp. TaxID=395353 RepID=UPI0030DB1A6A|tara:strand:- start:15403 stop:16038 length:636 start_codon:yes stop_codon:yes gene_type:complete
MKKLSYLSFIAITLLTINLSYGQDTTDMSYSKFSFIAQGGIGFAKVENDNQANYDLNVNTGEFLLNYRFNEKFGVFTGVALTEFSGSGFNEESVFYHERSVLKIPLGISSTYQLSDKIKSIMSIGAFAQTVTSDEYRYFDRTVSDLYEGWTFGLQFNLGMTYKFNKTYSVGIIFSGQSDLSKLETTNNASFNDEQKITGLNTLGFLFIWDL